MNKPTPDASAAAGSTLAAGSPLLVWCFGCIGEAGHYLRSPDGRTVWDAKAQPWGWSIDGSLCEGPQYQRADGKVWTHHKDGWTAVAFWDQSGDHRGASNTAFLVNAEATTEAVLAAAREQWPQVFNRAGFPLANGADQPRPTNAKSL